MSLFNTNSNTFLALKSLKNVIGMSILAKFFVVEKCLLPCIMRSLIVYVLSKHLFLATLESLIHGIHQFKDLDLKIQSNITTFITHLFMRSD